MKHLRCACGRFAKRDDHNLTAVFWCAQPECTRCSEARADRAACGERRDDE